MVYNIYFVLNFYKKLMEIMFNGIIIHLTHIIFYFLYSLYHIIIDTLLYKRMEEYFLLDKYSDR